MTKQDRKQKQIQKAEKALKDAEIEFTLHNNGYHFVVEESVDFWPTSKGELWMVKIDGKRGYGLKELIKEIKKHES